jgi:hypothetical protein
MLGPAKQWQAGVQVSYYVANEWGYYHVTLQILNQQIAVSGPAFRKILGINYNVECGCREITVQEAVDLGFVFPTKQS